MAYGVKALRQIRMALETTAGTNVTATMIWRGTGVMKDETELVVPEEDVGSYEPKTRVYIPKVGASVELDEVPATFEELPLLLSCGIEGFTTGAVDTGGSGFVYQFDVPAAGTANAIKTLSVEMGDNNRVDEMSYGYAESITLSGAKGEAVMMGATLRGRQVSDTDFSGSLSVGTVEEILFQKGQLWIDTTTIGTTTASNTWLGFSLDIPTGWQPIYTGDGNLYFSAIKYVGHKDDEITGELVLEHDATAEAEITAARAGTTRLIRMKFQGEALTTAGTYTNKTLIVNMTAKYSEVPALEDEDGDDIVTLPFRVISNGTTALQAIVVNQVNTLGTV